MLVKQMAASGHQQATKLYAAVLEKYGRQQPVNQTVGYLVVPERLTKEEWVCEIFAERKAARLGHERMNEEFSRSYPTTVAKVPAPIT